MLALIDSGLFGSEAGALQGRPYYVMPFVNGESLRHRLERLAELYEAKGNTARAIDAYARFAELWKNAEAELQPRVAEVRRRIDRLRNRRG